MSVHVEGDLDDVPESTPDVRLSGCSGIADERGPSRGRQKRERIPKRSDTQLHVRVQDDGAGFQASSSDAKGLGLVGMEERVRELGGVFRVGSRSGEGTQLTVEFARTWSISA